jgi:hypothetical protein
MRRTACPPPWCGECWNPAAPPEGIGRQGERAGLLAKRLLPFRASRPRRRAAWESDDRTSTWPGQATCWPMAVRVLGQCRNPLLPAPLASRTELDVLNGSGSAPVGETMPA